MFFSTLREGEPQYVEGDKQKIRNVLLEILNRLPPYNEVLKPYVSELVQLVMYVLEVDNEENAIIAIRIIFDVHKNNAPHMEKEVPQFLAFFTKLYENLQATVESSFQPSQVRSCFASYWLSVVPSAKCMFCCARSYCCCTGWRCYCCGSCCCR